MRKRKLRTSSLWHIGATVVLMVFVFCISYWDPKGIRVLWRLHQEKTRLALEISDLETQVIRLRKEISAFRNNKRYQEQVVRLQTGYARPNEYVVEWVQP